MNIKTLTVATAMSFAFLTTLAFAGYGESKSGEGGWSEEPGATHMQSPRFEDLDTDGDGLISAEELNVYGSTAAGNVNPLDIEDANEDGVIDRNEFEDSVTAE